MYRTCLHCHGPLGTNEVVEHFPVGRRLAFDAAKGRLWVVCDKCRRWNLTPLEERWEAIEECEREFSRTRLRASTDNIAVARVPAGLDLVRVGAPKFPELAAWRYGKSLHHRWKTRAIPFTAVGMTGVAAQMLSNAHLIGFAGALGLIGVAALPAAAYTLLRSRVRVLMPDGKVAAINSLNPRSLELEPDGSDGWALRLATRGKEEARATGANATHALRGVLTSLNFFGGRIREVDEAISLLNRCGDVSRYIARVASAGRAHGSGSIALLPPDVRLGLEMALHEDAERRALEGELALLDDEWKLAEEIANIADNLFVPDLVRRGLASLKRGEARQ